MSNLTIAGWRKSYGAGGRMLQLALVELVPNLGDWSGPTSTQAPRDR
jgi:hypothetical protein